MLDQTLYPVEPLDALDAEVSQDGSSVTVMIHNATQNWTLSTDTSASGLSLNSAEWIAEHRTA